MTNAEVQKEWKLFLKEFDKSDAAALKFAKKMQDPTNKKTALAKLNPSRMATLKNYMDAQSLDHQKKMWQDSGFMPKLNDPKMGYR